MRKVVLPKPEGTQEETQDQTNAPAPARNLLQQGSTEKPDTSENMPLRSQKPRPILPPEMMNIIVPSLQVGTATGIAGLFVGAISGIMTASPPALVSALAGGRWFVLGSSYYAGRTVTMKAFTKKGDAEPNPMHKVMASTVAGGFAGTIGGLLRSAKHIVPNIILFSLCGGIGQYAVNKLKWESSSEPSKGFLQSTWSPVTFMTDEEYETILQEKLLRVEAEMAVIDDNIKELRETEKLSKQQLQTREQPGDPQPAASKAADNKGV